MKNYIILFLFAALACGCAWMQNMFGPLVETIMDPEVQAAGGSVIRNVIAGNYLGALAGLGELAAAVGFTWKAVNMTRDRRRLKGTDIKPVAG